jgi:hypothetical protein
MTDKAVISEYTYRTLKEQREASGDMLVFVLPDDLPQLFRSTTRKTDDCLHVDSLAVLAEKEDKFREFLALAKKRKNKIVSREDNQTFIVNGNCENLVKWWKDARRKGSAKIGGERGGAKKKAAVEQRAKGLTKEEWTNGSIKNAQLADKYDMSINTLKRIASDKGWGHNRQQAIWRKQRNAKR